MIKQVWKQHLAPIHKQHVRWIPKTKPCVTTLLLSSVAVIAANTGSIKRKNSLLCHGTTCEEILSDRIEVRWRPTLNESHNIFCLHLHPPLFFSPPNYLKKDSAFQFQRFPVKALLQTIRWLGKWFHLRAKSSHNSFSNTFSTKNMDR